jgi:HK97 family phage prohead protease
VTVVQHERKTEFKVGERGFPVIELKATGSAKGGKFEAIVAVFDNIDRGYDRILKGAFERTLKAPPEGRGYPPIVWSHIWSIPPIGATMEAEEVAGVKSPWGEIAGLRIAGTLFVEEAEYAKAVYAAMRAKGGDGLPPLREFSFGYGVKESEFVEETPVLEDGTEVDPIEIRNLIDLDLYEVGPTLVGMNPETLLLDVKSQLSVLFEKGIPPAKTGPGSKTGDDTPEDRKDDPGASGVEAPDTAAVNDLLTAFPR